MSLTDRVYSVLLTMLSGDAAPEGPGWYIMAHSPSAHLPARRVSSAQAIEIGSAFEQTIPVGDETLLIHPFEVVNQGTEASKGIIQDELEKAEAAALNVARLRRLLGEGS